VGASHPGMGTSACKSSRIGLKSSRSGCKSSMTCCNSSKSGFSWVQVILECVQVVSCHLVLD
jgi:hypothetical protein